MGPTEKHSGLWRFAVRVVLPVVFALGITIAAVAWFALWSTSRSDERALQRESHLVGHAIDEQIKDLVSHEDYYANWDEALTALKNQDTQWLDENLGSELYDAGKYDRIYVLNPAVRAVYAMYGGGKTGAGHFEADRALVAPMVDRLKQIDAAGAMAAYDNDNTEQVPRVTDLALVDGKPAFVGVMTIMSSSGDMTQKPGSESFLVCIRFLDAGVAKDLMDQYLISDAAFAPTGITSGTQASYPIANAAGKTIAWFTWSPDRPGAQILTETLPSMLAALGVAAIVLLVLLRGLRRTTLALEMGKAKAEYQANHDTLTGLANRALFNRRLEEALADSGRGATKVALLALDLDRFKQVNDTLGHEAGDQLLREVGQRLAPLVGPADTVARLGGDEFAVIQRNVRDKSEVGTLSDRIIASVGAPFVLAGKVAQIGVSIGVVIAPQSRAARDLASKADIALYEAKAAGRNTYRVFSDDMAPAAEFRGTVNAELKANNLPGSKVA